MTLPAWWCLPREGGEGHESPRATLRLLHANDTEERQQAASIDQIAVRIRAGDEEAFAQVFRELYAELVAYVIRAAGEASAAEDIVQTVFVELWQRRRKLVPATSLRAYLYAAVRYRTLDRKRNERRADSSLSVYAGELQQPERDALQTLEQDERAVRVRLAFAALSPRARETLLLVRDAGLTYQETASVMGVSVNTIKTQLSRAVAALRQALTDIGL